jgi:hypothetical protein
VWAGLFSSIDRWSHINPRHACSRSRSCWYASR